MPISSYRELHIWQRGMDVAAAAYELTTAFPKSEQFGMTSQIRRAASSIPANIAEGYGRGSKADYARFVVIAQGSLYELETHLLLSVRVGLTTEEATAPLMALCVEEARMIGGWLTKARASLS